MRRFRRILRNIGIGLLVLIVVLVAAGVWFVRRPWPQIDGQLSVEGLSAPVQVIRDKSGIPHIYAQSDHDLFFAQGYVHAQDRLWEMEINRRSGSGTLSAVIGAPTLGTDQLIRTMGWRRAAEKDWGMLDADARAQLTSYSDGVNAFINTHRNSLPIEFTILGDNPEPWTPIDTLAWGKAITFSLAGNYRLELLRAQIIAQKGEAAAQELLPPYEKDKPIIVPPDAQGYSGFKDQQFPGLTAADAFLGEPGPVSGSNNWVVAGSRTTTGKPLLANDTHLQAGIPSIWYENGLHGGRFDVVGFTFPGVPGVILGHNQHIAWGVSNVNPDVEDLYMEKFNDPNNPTQYQANGQWQPIEVITDTIQVKGRAPQTLRILQTRHGPIINDAIAATPGVVGPLAFRWAALDGSTQFKAILQVDMAQNWDQFRQALTFWDSPSQNFVYADVDGNIGYQSPGKVPVRGKGDGRWPAPGWDRAYDWKGFIPFEELPSEYNPSGGVIVTANQAVIGPQYQHLLTHDWDYGYRSQRIMDLIRARLATGKLGAEDIRQIQFDNRNAFAPELVAALPMASMPAEAAVLSTWDFQQPAEEPAASSVAAALYNVFWRHLLTRTFDELPADRKPGGDDRWWEVVRPLLADRTSPWWDDRTTPTVETRDDILVAAMRDAVADLKDRQGSDPAGWRWGKLHTLTLTNQTFGESGIGPIEWLFNRGPFGVSGGPSIVNATGWSADDPDDRVYTVDAVPSMRMIVDLSNLDASRWVQLTGNSGHAFSDHYDDQFELWRTGQNLPMRWDRPSIEAEAVDTLTLRP